jgi:2',3'-cyclic-nucleotide 2'-phosphodiesterase (5'-nucleotidase family)
MPANHLIETFTVLLFYFVGPTVRFNDILRTVRDEVHALETKGINKIIALGHAGFDMDKQLAGIDGIDLVIGGHTNTFLYNGMIYFVYYFIFFDSEMNC